MFRLAAASLFAVLAFPSAHATQSLASGMVPRADAAPLTSEPFTRVMPAGDTLVLSAPPREPLEESERLYRPLADYLGRTLGRRVEYRHPGDWGVYRALMLKGAYDLVFDDPHLNSYRAERLGHQVVARLPGSFQYAAIARTDYVFKSVQRMHGRTFCTYAPPHLGTLFVLSFFDNPSRQPSLVSVSSWEEAYRGVVSGRCTAGVLPLAVLRQLDPQERETKVLFNSAMFPNQALSAGPRLTPVERERIVAALTAPHATEPTARLRAAWGGAANFVPATRDDYEGLAEYLRSEWGFY